MDNSKLSQESLSLGVLKTLPSNRQVSLSIVQEVHTAYRTSSVRTSNSFDKLCTKILMYRAWSSPSAHGVLRTPIGSDCTELEFWWHLTLPQETVQRTLIYLVDDSAGNLIYINAFEFVTVVLNYCATLSIISKSNLFADDPFPVILCMTDQGNNQTDNASALNWVNHRCKGSLLGRAIGRLFVSLLMDSSLGINAAWINTHDIEVAGGLSRFKSRSKTLLTNIPLLIILCLNRNTRRHYRSVDSGCRAHG